MTEYLLWQDMGKHTPAAKLADALTHFRNRFGYDCETVWLNDSEPVGLGTVTVELKPFVRPGTCWLALKDAR